MNWRLALEAYLAGDGAGPRLRVAIRDALAYADTLQRTLADAAAGRERAEAGERRAHHMADALRTERDALRSELARVRRGLPLAPPMTDQWDNVALPPPPSAAGGKNADPTEGDLA